MDDKQFFHIAAHAADQVVMQLTTDKLDQPTPCTEWNVKQLVGHMVYEIAWIPDMLAGKTVAEIGDAWDGDLLADQPVEAWRKYLKAAVSSVEQAAADGQVHLSYKDTTVADYTIEVGGDIAIHAWDLAQALGVPYHLPNELITEMNRHYAAMLEPMREAKYIAAAVTVAPDADAETKLLANLGRSQAWAA